MMRNPVVRFLITATLLAGLSLCDPAPKESPNDLRIIVSIKIDDVTWMDGQAVQAGLRVHLRAFDSKFVYSFVIRKDPDAQNDHQDAVIILPEMPKLVVAFEEGQKQITQVLAKMRGNHKKLILASTRPSFFSKPLIPDMWETSEKPNEEEPNLGIQRLLLIFNQRGKPLDQVEIPHIYRLLDDTEVLIERARHFPQSNKEWRQYLSDLYNKWHTKEVDQDPHQFIYKFAIMRKLYMFSFHYIPHDELPSTEESENKDSCNVVWVSFLKAPTKTSLGNRERDVNLVVMKDYSGGEPNIHHFTDINAAIDNIISVLNRIRGEGSKLLLMFPNNEKDVSETLLIETISKAGNNDVAERFLQNVSAYLHDDSRAQAVRIKILEAGIPGFGFFQINRALQHEENYNELTLRDRYLQKTKNRDSDTGAMEIRKIGRVMTFMKNMNVRCDDLAKTTKYNLDLKEE